MRKTILIILPLLAAVLSACDGGNLDAKGWVTSPSDNVEKRFEASMAYNRSLGLPSELEGFADGPIAHITVDTIYYEVSAASDIHIADSTHYLEGYAAWTQSEPRVEMGLLVGDYIMANNRWCIFYGGLQAGFITAQKLRTYHPDQEPLAEARPYLATVGNHDLFFNQWVQYCDGQDGYQGLHTSTWYAVVELTETAVSAGMKDIYISLDTGSGTLGHKQMEWFRRLVSALQAQREMLDVRHVVVITHTNIFKKDGSQRGSLMPMEETAELMHLFQEAGISIVLQGHDHYREESVYGGVTYLTLDCLKEEPDKGEDAGMFDDRKSSFCLLRMGEEIKYEFLRAGATYELLHSELSAWEEMEE